ncbi:MAG: dUTP diphosphatase [Acholeplasmatales bacterium]|nr:MAG: dUTP diphosphatase [Acholeplasmatales bacterium]
MRGFEVAKGYTQHSVSLPERGTMRSAGYDFAILKTLTLKPGEIALAETGIKAFMQDDEVLKLYPRSSLPRKYGVTIPNNVGIIDADYYGNEDNDGAIYIQLYNFRNVSCTIEAGTKIAQGIFEKFLRVPDEAPNHRVRSGGFGSTDR